MRRDWNPIGEGSVIPAPTQHLLLLQWIGVGQITMISAPKFKTLQIVDSEIKDGKPKFYVQLTPMAFRRAYQILEFLSRKTNNPTEGFVILEIARQMLLELNACPEDYHIELPQAEKQKIKALCQVLRSRR